MSTRRGGGKSSVAVNGKSQGKGINPQNGYSSGYSGSNNSNDKVDQLSQDVANVSLDSTEDGDWEVFSKKSRNKTAGNAQQRGTQNSAPNAWSRPNNVQKFSTNGNNGTGRPTGAAWKTQSTTNSKRVNERGNANTHSYNRNLDKSYVAQPVAVAPPLQQGWNWAARAGSSTATPAQGFGAGAGSDSCSQQQHSDVDEDDDFLIEDEDDDLMSDDFDSDSDESLNSHESRKQHKWFKYFFEVLDSLTVEQLNDSSRQWHCPACQNGPGSIDWYRGLQPLMSHAKTKGSKRVKIHRVLAKLLEEELFRRGTSTVPPGETFGKWEGLRETISDREIVWPPMVVVTNTLLEMDENDEKWTGMGNPELLEHFGGYKPLKARQAYGPRGHRGLSILIFESSVMGYLEAERLDKHFSDQGTDRYAWNNKGRVLFYPGGKRQLYGYMALKEDIYDFNKHLEGKSKVKFEMKSYQQMVVVPLRQMSVDNEQLQWLKDEVAKEQKHSKALETSFGMVSQKLRKTMEENRIVRERTKMQHEQNREEEEVAEFIESQNKGIEEFELEREKLIKMHEDRKAAMKRRQNQEAIDLEKDFESSLTRLMEHYASHSSDQPNTTITTTQ
ncbi:Protein SUPPRESSOR OF GENESILENCING [Ranunculus cassubicifolius]